MKKALSLFLIAALLLSVSSCGETATSADTTASDTSAVVETKKEYTRAETPDNLPKLDFGGSKIGVLFPESYGGKADKIDWVEEDDGDVVNSAVWTRQTKVEERLNVKFEIDNQYNVNQWKDALTNSVLAGDGNYDIVYGPQAISATLVTSGIYSDLSNAKYLDFEQPWWNTPLMDEMAIGNKRYLLAGDISLSMLSYMSCFYYNKDKFAEFSGEDADALYQTVLDGNWTMDKLASYCKLGYRDINGNSTAEDSDAYGMGVVTGSTTDHMTFDSGVKFTSWDKSGKPIINLNTEKIVTFSEKLYSFFYENEGVHIFPGTQDSLRITLPNKLINGEVIFMSGYFYSATLLRDMKADYGIIPYPKLDSSIDHYSSLVHDSAALISVPVTCTNTDAVYACLEAIAAENYRTVTPTYYEIALKTKYTRDELSGQIIDMIHESGTTDFAYVYSYALEKVGVIMRTLITNKSKDISSLWASVQSKVEAGLSVLVEAFEETN